jgi:alpha-glucan phosphorylase-like protein
MKKQKGQWCLEVSWEVANPVGGIHTVLATKAEAMLKNWGDNYVVMGPWLPGADNNPYFKDEAWIQADSLLAGSLAQKSGVRIRVGRWLICGEPRAILVDFSSLWGQKNDLLSDYWERFGLESLLGGYDYQEPVLFGAACGRVAIALSEHENLNQGSGLLLHAHEWMTASAILELLPRLPRAATTWTTHATALGRSLSARADIPAHLSLDQVWQMAIESKVTAKHSMEQVAARVSHAFTTVSEVTAAECELLFGRKPDVVLPNAISRHVPDQTLANPKKQRAAREHLLSLASKVTGFDYSGSPNEPLVLITAGRYEFRNKGIDVVLEALASVNHRLGGNYPSKVILFAMLPSDSLPHEPPPDSFARGKATHELRHPHHDPILRAMQTHGLKNHPSDPVHVVFVPRYLDGRDAEVSFTYWELLAGADLSLFPSWYEPWGYTPMESVALGVPTVSSDMAGFAHWARDFGKPLETGVFILHRHHRPDSQAILDLANLITEFAYKGPESLKPLKPAMARLAEQGNWDHAIAHYERAHEIAFTRTRKPVELSATKSPVDVAYLSMEFGLSAEVPIYSGGLGILAGDHLKAARDLNLKVWGVGIAYAEGYFSQHISGHLSQEERPQRHGGFEKIGFKKVEIREDEPLIFDVPAPDGRKIKTRAWRLDLGNSALLLLDSDLEENPQELRSISRRLYTSDRDMRWAQEYFLGIGAVLLLEHLNVKPKMFHMNEGHTALSSFARIAQLMNARHLTFHEAILEIRPHTLFTTHTPVPAGLERFEWSRIERSLDHLAAMLRVSTDRLKALGIDPAAPDTGFSMTALAIRTSATVNSVAKLHGFVSAGLLAPVVHSYPADETPPRLLTVTNGVHPQTWISAEWQELFTQRLGANWASRFGDLGFWKRINDLSDEEIWSTHARAKNRLRGFLRTYLTAKIASEPSRAEALKEVLSKLGENTMVITWARRFAAYKRPELLFRDPGRLKSILAKHPDALFVFAGKAHPADPDGKDRIARLLAHESSHDFRGRVVFIEDYNMEVASYLVSGSDVWLNVPLQLREASGTSGMKAVMNGVLNLSTNDGWVYEAVNGEVSWRIGLGLETMPAADQDELHSRELYRLFSHEVIPEFFFRDRTGIPRDWVKRMKLAMSEAIPRFSAQRMVREYAALYGLTSVVNTESKGVNP